MNIPSMDGVSLSMDGNYLPMDGKSSSMDETFVIEEKISAIGETIDEKYK